MQEPRTPTTRQRRVLHMVAAGCLNKEIAQRMGISEGAVKKHLENLRRRYRAGNRASLVRAAIDAGHIRTSLAARLRRAGRSP